MPTFDELYESAFKRRQTVSPGTVELTGGPVDLGSQEPTEPIGPAARSGGRALLHHGLPVALQMALSAAAPETIPAQLAAGGLGSLGGYLYQSGVEPKIQGKPAEVTGKGILGNLALGAGMTGLARAGGSLVNFLSGKSNVLSAGKEAAGTQAEKLWGIISKTGAKAESEIATAGKAVETAQGAVNREILKHGQDALAGVKESEVERIVRQGLGPTPSIQQPITIESLTAATAPAQKAAQQAMKGVFKGISAKFDEALAQYREIPIPEPTIGAAASALEQDVREAGLVLSPSFRKILDQAKEMSGGVSKLGKERLSLMTAGGRTAPLSEKYLSNLTAEQFAAIMGGKDVGGALKGKVTTVEKMMGLRTQFVETLMGSKDAVDRRTASSMIEAIDRDINGVIPAETQAALSNLRDEWHQARSTFSDTFRSRLFRASSPDQVAEAIYTGAKTGKQMGHRAALLVNQVQKESPDQLPLLRQSFAGMISARPDAVAEISKMEPSVFKALFGGTGFDDPKKWVDAIRGQVTLQKIAQSPELMAKWNSAFQSGMGSLGTRAKKAALAKAEENLRNTPDAQAMIAEALKSELTPEEAQLAAGMTAMKKPLGGSFHAYMEHRLLFHTLLSVGAFSATHNPAAWALPLVYLGSSKAVGAMLANPTIGRMYYNMLTSPTLDQMGFWAGRLTASGLTEAARSAQ